MQIETKKKNVHIHTQAQFSFSLSDFSFATGHYRHYQIDYEAAVAELLGKAAGIYAQRIRQLEGERLSVGDVATRDEIIEPIQTLRKAAASSNAFQGMSLATSDDFLLPSSMPYYEGRDVGSMRDEQREDLIHLSNVPRINAHGVLGQILFDVCVPKNIENWDIRSSDSSNRRPFTSTRRHSHFNPIKCIRRSRLQTITDDKDLGTEPTYL